MGNREFEKRVDNDVINNLALHKGIFKTEIGRLTDENVALKAEVERVSILFHEKCDVAANSRCGIERLQKDSERLKWLIDGGIYALEARVDEAYGFEVNLSVQTIDAAMKETK
ncbi:hypothetical protein SAMN05216428_102316 [Nitrosospira sp. Nsp11]|uniref:hypothetical protein n=1 Tax=Nitrosospira sp. Nsp11 TaxID=1855338 RepID=UPI00091A332D|nr:hypothetical protein [Nitrosospira sp. Nsp11]SHL41071.1 hypothetical protein SAMN05216428_102316 [Nitrosospira sp. Nsp11]